MKAVIMAGGMGTRLRPITYEFAKPAVPIAGKPCIYYVLQSLSKAGIRDIIITSGYRLEDIIDTASSFEQELGLNIVYSFEREPMGTAGGVKKIESYLDSTFLVASGDVLTTVDFGKIVSFHKSKQAIATMALTHTDNPTEYGIVGLDDSGSIVRFKEKPRQEEVFSTLINAGIYVLELEALDYIPPGTKFDFSKDTFPKILSHGKGLYGVPIEGVWKDIGRPSDLLDSNRIMCMQNGSDGDGVHLIGNPTALDDVRSSGSVYIGSDVKFGKEVTLENAYIHHGVVLGNGASVQNSIVMDGSSIGEGVTLRDSIILKNCTVEKDAVIESSIIGSNTIIHMGSTLKGMKIWDGNISTP